MLNKKTMKRDNILFFNEDSTNKTDIGTFCIDYRTGKTEIPLINNDYTHKKHNCRYVNTPKIKETAEFLDNDNLENAKECEHKYYNQEIKIHKKIIKRPAIFKAVLCLTLCIIGTTILVNSASVDTFDAIYEENYNDFLLPVTLNDPDQFNSINELNPDKILSSSIWYTVLNQDDRYYTNYDEIGRLIIPVEDVAKSAAILFGSSYSMPIQNPSFKTFFELDNDGKNYLVCPISNHESYLPTILSKTSSGNEIILHVGYSRPEDPFWTSIEKKSPPTPEKIMNYILAKDNNTGRMYIKSIQKPTDNL